MTFHFGPLLDRDAIWAAIDRERLDLADLLDDLSEQEWAHPSLCAGWRVRDVAAHLALAQMPVGAATAAALRSRGNFHRMIRDSAVRHAAVPTDQLADEIRGMAGSRRHAPGITDMEPLLDVLVHGQDIAVPIGRPRTMPLDAAAAAATRVWTYRWPFSTVWRAPARLAGLELVATDTDWSAGAGARVEGPIQALLLLLTGRTGAAVANLSGPGVPQLASAGSSP